MELMPILPRTTKYVELGTLLFECNKRFNRKLFTINIEIDDSFEKTGKAELSIHEIDKETITGKKKKVELIIKELMDLLGDYHYGD